MRLAIILFFTAALSLPAEIVTILPDSTTIAQGSDTQISIEISDLTTDLYAFQFDLVYAPAIDALDANEGAFLPGAGATLFIGGTIDNTGDTISAIADTILDAGPGATGSGTLVTVDVTGVSPGTAALSLANATFLDSNLDTLTFTEVDSSITVTATPEPATWLLVLSVMVVVCVKSATANARDANKKPV